MEIYLVGGAVRDQLLDLPVTERDWVVVGATPQAMLDQGYRQVGKDFPVFLHPDTHEEYALARTERKTGPGYTGFDVHADPGVTLEADLQRRDLTINAIAQTADGQYIDPFNGREDLRLGRLQHISPAFAEDPVRILRVARFAARFARYGFRVAHGTNKLMKEMVTAGEVDHLVPERVWAETVKALAEPNPERFFEVLHACGALARLFPELHKLFGVPQTAKHHPEIDTGVHTLMVLQQAAGLSPDADVRFAALVHDLGKGETPDEVLPQHIGHEARSVKLVKGLCERLKAPNDFRDLAVMAAKYHTHCHRVQELRAATLVKTLDALDALRRPERFTKFLLACEADARGRKGKEQEPYPQAQIMQRARDAAAAVQSAPFIEQGLKNKKLGEALHKERVRVVQQVLDN